MCAGEAIFKMVGTNGLPGKSVMMIWVRKKNFKLTKSSDCGFIRTWGTKEILDERRAIDPHSKNEDKSEVA